MCPNHHKRFGPPAQAHFLHFYQNQPNLVNSICSIWQHCTQSGTTWVLKPETGNCWTGVDRHLLSDRDLVLWSFSAWVPLCVLGRRYLHCPRQKVKQPHITSHLSPLFSLLSLWTLVRVNSTLLWYAYNGSLQGKALKAEMCRLYFCWSAYISSLVQMCVIWPIMLLPKLSPTYHEKVTGFTWLKRYGQ